MMGFKLRFLSWWTPKKFQKKGLDELAKYTISGLDKLVDDSENSDAKCDKASAIVLTGNIEERRRDMAIIHNEKTEELIKALGHEHAMELGYKTMFNEGLLLGKKFRKLLGVGNSLEDLITAAKILYKVLGIEFRVKEYENGMCLVVNHCSLSKYYTSDTCKVLSGADEGVVQGLNPHIKMNFTERMTDGASCCMASIQFEDDAK